MSWRTVVVSQRCKLETKMGYMICRGEKEFRIHLSEIAVVVIENNAVSLTVSLITELISKKIKIITCDDKHNPYAEVLPIHGCHNNSRCLKTQLSWTNSNKAIVWQSIIKQKITNQANIVKDIDIDAWIKISSYVGDVLPGDINNREGHAAKVYFNSILGDGVSRRDESVVNSCLNYGYSILLSAINREVVAIGMLTQIGIWHDNEYNHFNLSCDLVEPYRQLIDIAVIKDNPAELDRVYKHRLLDILNGEVTIDGRKQTVLNSLAIYVRSVVNALEYGDSSLIKFAYYEL